MTPGPSQSLSPASVFSTKLGELPETIRRVASEGLGGVTDALRKGGDRLVYAVGSGGSAVACEFLARCRTTLGYALTVICTPEAFALNLSDLRDNDVWIFSAGGRNADAQATLASAIARKARAVHIVTSNATSELAIQAAAHHAVTTHVIDVAGQKDGFLATHSLVGALAAIHIAADRASPAPRGQEAILELLALAELKFSHGARSAIGNAFAEFRPDDCLLLLADPRLGAAATLLDTSLWEAAVCPVQQTDFRNFAHGRHVWPVRRRERSFVISLTGAETRASWANLLENLSPIRFASLDYQDCGRFQGLRAVFDGFAIIEALGQRTGIDPAKPGPGPTAANIYDARTLLHTVQRRTAPAAHKQIEQYRRDDPKGHAYDWAVLAGEFQSQLASVDYWALVLDFDGTIIPASDPYARPAPEIVEELIRLLDHGVTLAIATGRGGSLGSALRAALPSRYWDSIPVGYYNGSYLKPLSVDIDNELPELHPDIDEIHGLLAKRSDLFRAFKAKNSRVQLSIQHADLVEPQSFIREFQQTRFGGSDELRLVDTGRTLDIVLSSACKTQVVEALMRTRGKADRSILCIGDSGGRTGNDHVLLGHAFGVSVGHVCDRPDACWSLFGTDLSGPDALHRILLSLRGDLRGYVRLDLEKLTAGQAVEK